jgi:hypothetical protein
MSAYYIEIQGIYEDQLEFSGYVLVDEDADFQLFVRDGHEFLLPKNGRRFLPLEVNDADMRRSRRRAVPIPPR